MKLISWNANGLENRIAEDFLTQFDTFDADFFCLQNTDLPQDQLHLDLPGYQQFWRWADEHCSGLAVFTKYEPRSVQIGDSSILLEYPEFCLCNGTPDSLPEDKPLIACGFEAHGLTDTLKMLRPNAQATGFQVSADLKESVYGASLHSAVTEPGPVSLDIDLPCNGSILSPTSLGKARVISQETPQEPPAESTTEETPVPKSFKLPKKWILAISAALVLLLCAILLWPSSPKKKSPVTVPEDLVPIQITELQDIPRCYDYIAISSGPPKDAMGSTLLIVTDETATSPYIDPFTYTDPFLLSDLEQATFCIQVQLTEEALELDKNGWEFSASTSIGATSSMPDVIIENYNVIPYYTSDARLRIAGWIIFGNVHEKFPLVMTVSRSDSDYTYQDHSVYGTHYHIDPPEVPFHAEYLIAPPVLVEESKIDPDTQIEYDLLSFDCVYTYYVTQRENISSPTPYTTSIQDASYWIFIKVDSTLREKVGFRYLDFTVSKPDQSTGQSFFQYREPFASAVYSDPDLTNLTGWLIYDANPQVNDLVFTLRYWSKGEEIVYTLPFHFATYVTEEQAADMYTHALIRAIFNNPTLCDEILSSLYPWLPNTPVCQELETRTDAVAQVMNWDISTLDTEYHMVPNKILLCLRDQMTPEEEAKFLLSDFPSCPYPLEYSNMIEVETDTEGIVSLLSEERSLWTFLSFGDDAEVQRQIYLRLRQRCSLLLMLEQCDDAAEVMLEHIKVCESDTCQMNLLYNMWDWIQTQT